MRKRFLLYPLFLLTLSLFVPWAYAAGVESSNWDYSDANRTFSCDLNLSGADMTGQIFAVLFAESGQMKGVTTYSPAETVHIDLPDTDTTDYIHVLWTNSRYAPVADPAVMRMRDNGRKAYEAFEEEMRKAGQNNQDGPQSATVTLLVSTSQAFPWDDYKKEYSIQNVIAGPNNFYVLKFSSETAAKACETALKALPCVRYVEYDDEIKLDADKADAGLLDGDAQTPPLSWGVAATGIGEYAADLKKRGLDNKEIIVAVVDSGVDKEHPFLKDRILNNGYDFVENNASPQDEFGHGTHVAGTVVDCTPGMNVKILPLRIFDRNGGGNVSRIHDAIEYAIYHGAKVINLSLGYKENKQPIVDAIQDAINKNVTVVVAASNDNTDAVEWCPANIEQCITVAAMEQNTGKLSRCFFSNYGNLVDIAAPGGTVNSCIPGGKYEARDGTSMAAPHVAAAAALLMCERGTGQTPHQIEQTLKDAASAIPEDTTDDSWSTYQSRNPGVTWTDFLGAGFLNMRPFIKRTVTFNANGGSGSMNKQTVSHGATLTLPDCKFTRTDYSFNGWNTKANGTGTAYAAGASLTVSADLTLYAQWKQIPKPVSTKYLSWGVTATHMDAYAASLQKRGISKEVIVAVVDSGVDKNHEFLKDRLLPGHSFLYVSDKLFGSGIDDELGHGTHVAGIIADCTRGTNVKILPVRVLDKYGNSSPLAIATGIHYAAEHGADVICLAPGYHFQKHDEEGQVIDEAVQYALGKGITVVVAACSSNTDASGFCPAHIEDCITVAAVDENLNRWSLSNFGTVVDIAAPGAEINSSIPGNKYDTESGTSMCTAHVAAAAALLIADKGPLTPQEVSDMLKAAAKPLETDKPIGAGVLDMRAFLDVYAMLYSDGEMVFQYGDTPRSGRTLAASYPVSMKAGGAQYAAWYEKRAGIKTVTFADTVIPDSTASWFSGCTNLTKILNLSNLDTSQTTDMSQMFARCGLTTLNLSAFDTRNIVNMRQMFNNCSGLERLDLSGWDTANVTNMTDMFNGCSALKTVYASDSFTTGKVSDSEDMFRNCTALPNYDSEHVDKEYACTSAPGYFTRKG